MGCLPSKDGDRFGNNSAIKVPDILLKYDPDNTALPDQLCQSIVLTDRQQCLVRTAWTRIEGDMATVGRQLFLCIFDQNPRVKELFPFRDVWGDELLQHPQFVAHTLRFMAVIQGAVRAVDNLEGRFAPALVGLGARHTKIQGFTPELFKLFYSSMVVVFGIQLGADMTPEMQLVWRLLLEYTVRKLQQGYYGQARINQIIADVDSSDSSRPVRKSSGVKDEGTEM